MKMAVFCDNPEDSHLRTRRRENLKSHIARLVCVDDQSEIKTV
jgi:hypothetical protein